MELEEAIKELKNIWKETNFKNSKRRIAIGTVLRALEEYKEKELDYSTVYMNGFYDGQDRIKKKIENKAKKQIEEADEVLVGKEYIDNFEGSEENQEYYYNGYKDASLFIRDILEGNNHE